jgi:hypothetical protein
MVERIINQRWNIDFSLGAADLKKHVSIYTRKQIRQKRKGVSAR